ncbi:MAG: trk/ktr system potassium uptake protein [Sphaerochaeta sp.]|jgi:trk system potassium uptake protein TrkA|uniref:Uncharacterized protein n=1 Tax=Sphaerochaeta halotolerans TaxID=2293840 RepID=A0A372MJC7_9SPIR|nr:hypothetical protein [Sphaerochaeta halotolerans]MDK2860325.1 trk/ktr system potassium uptake protein [Sphaerochaeta sp.]MDN5334367.1 trk/ktr system potassium uptake protein [Sphaerochaeta sp.]RFU95869.1 hypothetical protein DYP60_02370 [Sphaerochaeta halotolerans]
MIISFTDNDGLNIITASYAKHIGIDVVISTTDTTVESLLLYFRGTNVPSVHALFNGQLEVYEFVAHPNSAVCDRHQYKEKRQ